MKTVISSASRALPCGLCPVGGFRFFAALLVLGFSTVLRAQPTQTVPMRVWDLQVTNSTEAQLKEAGRVLGRQSISMEQVSFLRRFPTDWSGWCWGAGMQWERLSLGGKNSAKIPDLQDVAGVFSLEYFVDGVQAAALSLKPGVYFSDRVHSDCFDVPVQLVSGIPVTDRLNGVIGGAAARFYNKPIPIFGLSWKMSSQWRLEAVFPEPALVYTPAKGVEVKWGGELQSGGFRMGSGAPVEYYSYQCKGRLSYAMGRSVTLSGALGYEVSRRLDYFRGGPSFQSEGALVLQLGAGVTF